MTVFIGGRTDVSLAELPSLLADLWEAPAVPVASGYALVATADDTRLLSYASGLIDAWAVASSEGRLFREDREVRWRQRTDDRFTVVLAADAPPTRVPVDSLEVLTGQGASILTAADAEVYLWGSLLEEGDPGPEWYEQRIPRLLDYPGEARERVRLRVREYRDEEGQAAYVRFITVV